MCLCQECPRRIFPGGPFTHQLPDTRWDLASRQGSVPMPASPPDPESPSLGRARASYRLLHNWPPTRMHHHDLWHGLLDMPCLVGVSHQGVPGRLRASTGWWGGKQRDMAKGSRKGFITGCAWPRGRRKAFTQLPDVMVTLGRNPASVTCATAGHGAVVIVAASHSLPICRCQEMFQCIPGPLDPRAMVG